MHRESAHEIRGKVSSGAVSAEEVTKARLDAIAKLDGPLNSFLSTMEDRALAKAREVDEKRQKGKPLGKLAGVPVALKDLIQVKGTITTCASKMLKEYKSIYSATVVNLLEGEDAILIGKTNMDEFAMGASGLHSAFGPTKNPWNLDCVPGGSSSGSAAAVSAGLCPLSLGSDTGGSIRQPAAHTGIFGFKPTYGRVSRFGLTAFASSLDQIGPFGRTVEDVALIMEVIGQHCDRDATSSPLPTPEYTKLLDLPIAGKKIGVPRDFLQDLEPTASDAFEKALGVYKSLGAEIVDVDLEILKASVAIYYILATAEASTNLARFDGIRYGFRAEGMESLDRIYEYSRQVGFGWEVKNRILLGTYVLSAHHKEAYYSKAQKVRTLVIRAFNQAFGDCDVIAMPTAPSAACKLDGIQSPLQEYLEDLYTIPANMAGLPAISIPNGFTTDKRPLGLQIIGPQMKDERVLAFAKAYAGATDFWKKAPPGYGGAV